MTGGSDQDTPRDPSSESIRRPRLPRVKRAPYCLFHLVRGFFGSDWNIAESLGVDGASVGSQIRQGWGCAALGHRALLLSTGGERACVFEGVNESVRLSAV